MTTKKTEFNNIISNGEIDLITLAKTLYAGRKTFFASILLFGLIGFIIAVLAPKEFVATTIIVPSGSDSSSKLGNLGSLGGLAAMAGININSVTGNDLSPIVYPQIVASLPFQLELMKTFIKFKNLKEPVTFLEYYSKTKEPNYFLKYTIGLPGLIYRTLKNEDLNIKLSENENNLIVLTTEQIKALKILSELIILEVNAKNGILTLTSRMPEAYAAAQLGQRALELLQEYIIEIKIKKAKANLDFIQLRYNEALVKYEAAQQHLALFRDRNKNVSLATIKTEEEKLISQYNLIYSIYSEIAKQLEQAKIQVKQDTPVFTIIEPISVPTQKSKPNRPLILIIWIMLGGIIGTIIVLGREFKSAIIKSWNEDAAQVDE
ncbi:MAG: Wzz/FepE/Etk N-terminal domain-containing protein [Mariniphaga sp.]